MIVPNRVADAAYLESVLRDQFSGIRIDYHALSQKTGRKAQRYLGRTTTIAPHTKATHPLKTKGTDIPLNAFFDALETAAPVYR